MMTYKDYQTARNFIEKHALSLMQNEKKNSAKVGFPIQNYTVYPIKGRFFYSAGTNIFNTLVREVLLEAMALFPANFGNGNAVSVLHAINKTEPLSGRLKDAIRILQNGNCSYIIENVNGVIQNKVLRLDLFRFLKPVKNKKRRYDFVGGIMHALKHFSFNNKPLSTGTDINNIDNPSRIIELCISAFFTVPLTEAGNNAFCSYINIDANYNLKFIFHYQLETSVFFLKTIHKEKVN